MRLDLKKLIGSPGTQIPFSTTPDLSEYEFDGIIGFPEPLTAAGTVTNHAGALVLRAELHAALRCVCARCLKEFDRPYVLETEAALCETEPEDADTDMDIYLLDGDCIDTDEIVVTAFVLSLDQRQLCSEDCRGICPRCGKNLNDGPCDCRAESDPRLAVLGQLLEE